MTVDEAADYFLSQLPIMSREETIKTIKVSIDKNGDGKITMPELQLLQERINDK